MSGSSYGRDLYVYIGPIASAPTNILPGQRALDGNNEYWWNGTSWCRSSASAMSNVIPKSIIGVQKVREVPFPASSSNSVRLDFGSAIVKAVRVWVMLTAGTATVGMRFLLSIDAPNVAIDTGVLADPVPDDGSVDLQRFSIMAGSGVRAADVFEDEFVDVNGAPAPIRYLTVKPEIATAVGETYRAFVEYTV